MALEVLGYLLLALVGIALSALFSGMETGLYTLNRVRLAVRASRGDPQAVRLRSLTSRPSRMLSTLLIGNNTANYAGSFGIAAILDYHGVEPVSAIFINVGILVSLLFVFGETLPKDLFRTHTDHWSYAFSSFLSGCARVLTWTGLGPLVEGFGALAVRLLHAPEAAAGAITARQRISQLIKEGVAAGVLSEHQTTLADRALAMRERRVDAVMVSWSVVVAVPADAAPEQRRDVIKRHPFARFPVVDRGKVIGVMPVLDALLSPEKPVVELLQPTLELRPAMRVREALRQMREMECELAIVTRRPGGEPAGIVTLKDLVEPLIGELHAW